MVCELMDTLGLSGKDNQNAQTFPLEKRSLVGSRLITQPKILLDEPTANIEPTSTIFIEKVLKRKFQVELKYFLLLMILIKQKDFNDIIYSRMVK